MKSGVSSVVILEGEKTYNSVIRYDDELGGLVTGKRALAPSKNKPLMEASDPIPSSIHFSSRGSYNTSSCCRPSGCSDCST